MWWGARSSLSHSVHMLGAGLRTGAGSRVWGGGRGYAKPLQIPLCAEGVVSCRAHFLPARLEATSLLLLAEDRSGEHFPEIRVPGIRAN